MYDTTKPYKHQILDRIRSTHDTPYLEIVLDDTCIITRQKHNLPEVDHKDGVGTKGVYHWLRRTFREAAIDGFRMNSNDLAMVRARPYKALDHIILPRDDREAIIGILDGLVGECKRHQMALVGGETAIDDTIGGLEISVSMTGYVPDPKPNRMLPGDVLLGLPSSGLHSNGFTKVRELFGTDDIRPEFTVPTADYWAPVFAANEKYDIHGMMNITGGAFTKLKDVLCDADACIRQFPTQPIFEEIYRRGVSDHDMHKTFNCGIGFVLALPESQAEAAREDLDAMRIGKVVPGKNRVFLRSAFSCRTVEY